MCQVPERGGELLAQHGTELDSAPAERECQSADDRRCSILPLGKPRDIAVVGAFEPHPDRAGQRVAVEHLDDNRTARDQVMPVVKLEQELLLDRQPAQRRSNRRELLLLAELLAR